MINVCPARVDANLALPLITMWSAISVNQPTYCSIRRVADVSVGATDVPRPILLFVWSARIKGILILKPKLANSAPKDAPSAVTVLNAHRPKKEL